MRIRSEIVLISIITIVGLYLSLMASYMGYANYQRARNSVKMMATVSGNKEDYCKRSNILLSFFDIPSYETYTCYHAVVDFSFQEKAYQVLLSSKQDDKYEIGSKIEVYVDPVNPQDTDATSTVIGAPIALLLIGLGAVFAGIHLIRRFNVRR